MIHPTAIVSPGARLGNNVSVGPFTIVHANVEIGDDTNIDGFCEIGYATPLAKGQPLVLGAKSLIRSHSVLYQGSTFKRLTTGHRVTVRELTVAGEDFRLGTLSDIQGHCTIGDYVRTHSNVHIGHASVVGNFVWIFPYVILTNDPHPPSDVQIGPIVEDYAAIATSSVILPGIRVGTGALVAAVSSVGKDVAPHTVVGGSPAKYICDTSRIKRRDGSGKPAYPWTDHFHRGYPEDVVARWLADAAARAR